MSPTEAHTAAPTPSRDVLNGSPSHRHTPHNVSEPQAQPPRQLPATLASHDMLPQMALLDLNMPAAPGTLAPERHLHIPSGTQPLPSEPVGERERHLDLTSPAGVTPLVDTATMARTTSP